MKVIKWDGSLPIKAPGIYSGIPISVYHGQDICPGPSVSSSNLRRVLELNGGSPAHMFLEWSGGMNQQPKPTDALTFGRAAHHLLLGQKNFRQFFDIRPDHFENYRTKDAQAWRDNCILNGITPLTPDDIKRVEGIRDALLKHPLIINGLLQGWIEHSIFWPDEQTGMWLKARPDSIPLSSADASDLKCTTSVQHIDIMNAIAKYGYHQQAALVCEGIERTSGVQLQSFSLVFAENEMPHCISVKPIRDHALVIGTKLNRLALDLIVNCIKRKEWLGPGGFDVRSVDLGNWYYERANAFLSRI